MELWEFMRQPENSAFFISLLIMLIMAVVEFITLMLGVSLSEAVDNLLPDFDIEGPEVDSTVPVLDWLNLGKVPLIVNIILLLTGFGLSGYILQGGVEKVTGSLLPLVPAVLIALVPTLVAVHFMGRLICRLLPQIETTAVTVETLKGSFAEITLGCARVGNPAEAKVKDRYGKVHYVRVVPGDPEEEFLQGDKVILVFYDEGIFQAEKVDSDLI